MKNYLKPILIGGAIIGLLVLFRMLNVGQYLQAALDWIEGLGSLAGVVFIVIYIFCAVLLVPASILTLGAGAVFGVIKGSIFVSIASTVGAGLAFLVGRYLARDWVSKKIEGNKKFNAIDDAVGNEGWKIVGLTRLSPVFPYNLLNYMYGLTKVKFWDYAIASWIGMMPGTVMYVYLGTAAGEGLKAAGGTGSKSPQEWALFGVGLAATVVVTVFVTKIAKKALSEKVA